jgi:hypothetical protein
VGQTHPPTKWAAYGSAFGAFCSSDDVFSPGKSDAMKKMHLFSIKFRPLTMGGMKAQSPSW